MSPHDSSRGMLWSSTRTIFHIIHNKCPYKKFFFIVFSFILTAEDNEENNKNIPQTQEKVEQSSENQSRDIILKALGVDLTESKFKEVKYHPELKNTWGKWTKQGLPEKNKNEILELYNRKAELYVEAPKLNLEIIPMLTEIAKKRDQHFLETQNCVGTALTALAAAVSTIIDPPEKGVDEDILTDYLSHAGQMMSDVFHQQSIARKSFITPQMDKSIKPTVEEIISDEWLYGNNLIEKVKNAKEIEKACAQIKDKSKKDVFKAQGNSKYPSATFRQTGQSQKRRFFKLKRKPFQRAFQSSFQTSAQNTTQTKATPPTTNQSLSKK